MYGLKADVSTAFLVGKKLIQVRIGEFQVQLCFEEDDVVIAADCNVSIDDQRYEEMRALAEPLASLLGTVTSRVDNPGNGDLVLRMSNGRSVVFHDSNAEYESYTVSWKGGYIVV